MSMGEVYKGLVLTELPTFSLHGVNGMTHVPHALSSPASTYPLPEILLFPFWDPVDLISLPLPPALARS